MTMYLYRKVMQAVTLATAIVLLSFSLTAQFRTPQAERKTPRAVGVLETFKNGSRRLVPVTFFYEKHYYDATFYHATPVPFTLYSETVYEIQQFGKPLGTFTVQSATENSTVWFGNGRFKGLPDPALLAKKRALHPVVLEDPSKPVLHRRAGSEGDNPVAHPTATANAPEADEDPDRPRLHRREGSGGTQTDANAQASTEAETQAKTKASTQTQTQTSGEQEEESSGQDPNRPKLHRRDDPTEGKNAPSTAPVPAPAPTSASAGAPAPAKASAGAPASASSKTSPAASAANQPALAELTPSDPDHPVLRRGKPVQVQSGHDLPDFKKEEPVSRQVAISDAGSSEAQSLIYVCPEEQRNQMEASVRELAQSELRRMAAQRGIPLIAPVKTPAANRKPSTYKMGAAKVSASPELKLEEEQFVPYDLDYNNYATVVYSARYVPEGQGSAGAGASAVSTKAKSWVVTVVARQDEGKMIKLYSAVSDPRELDLYPELRLVDALDPDGYGRAALLFREQKRDGVSWLLGRMTGYELQTVFETPAR